MSSNKIKGLTVEIGGETTELTAALKEVDTASKASSDELKEIERLLKMDPKSAELLSQKMTVLGESVSKAKEKLKILQDAEKSAREQFERGEIGEDQLRALQRETVYAENKLKKLELQYDDVKNSAKDGGKAIRDSGEAAKEAKKGAEDLSKSLDDLKDKYDDAKDSAKDAAADLGKGLAAAGAAVVAVTSAAMGYEDAMAAIQIQTGASAEEMEGYKSAVDGVFAAGLGEDLDDIASTMATIAQQTGETDPGKLEELARNALVLKDGFGFETAEQMRAVQMMVDHFGISAAEAYDLIVTGAQNGLNKNGDLLDIINEYSVHYKNLGYDAQGFFNSLASGASTGVFSVDKLGDAMKEFGIRVKDSGATTIDAMSNLGFVSLAALEELRGSEAELLADIASTKDKEKLQELQQQLQGVTEEIGAMEGALGAGAMSVEDLQAAFAAGGEKAAAASQTVLEALFAIQDPLKQNEIGVALFGTMWEDMGAEAIQALTSTEDVLGDVSGAMDAVNEISMETTSRKWEQLGRTVQQDLILPLGEKLLPAAQAFFGYCVENADSLIPKVKALAVILATIWAVNKVSKFIKSIRELVSAYKAMKSAIVAANSAQASSIWGLIAMAIGVVVGVVYSLVSAYNDAEDAAREQAEAAKEAFAEQAQEYQQLVENMRDTAEARRDTASAVEVEYSAYQDLWTELQKLVDADGNVLEGQEARVDYIRNVLSDAIGEEILLVDGQIAKYNELRDSIGDVILKQQAQAMLSNGQGRYYEAVENLPEYQDAYETANEEYLNYLALAQQVELAEADLEMKQVGLEVLKQNKPLSSDYGMTSGQRGEYDTALREWQWAVADKEDEIQAATDALNELLLQLDTNAQANYESALETLSLAQAEIHYYEKLQDAYYTDDPEIIRSAMEEMATGIMTSETGASVVALDRQFTGFVTDYAEKLYQSSLPGTLLTQEQLDEKLQDVLEAFFEAYTAAEGDAIRQLSLTERLGNVLDVNNLAAQWIDSGLASTAEELIKLVTNEGTSPVSVAGSSPSSTQQSVLRQRSEPLAAGFVRQQQGAQKLQEAALHAQEDVAVKTGLSVIHAERMVEHSRYLNDMMSGAPLVTGETMEVKDLQAEVSGKLLQKILKSVQDLDLTLVLNDGTLIARTVNKTDAALGKVAASGARGTLKE